MGAFLASALASRRRGHFLFSDADADASMIGLALRDYYVIEE